MRSLTFLSPLYSAHFQAPPGRADVVLPYSFRCFVRSVDDSSFILAFLPLYENEEDDYHNEHGAVSGGETPPASRVVCTRDLRAAASVR